MADKILRWYIDGLISRPKTWVGGSYTLDADYVPVDVPITAREYGKINTPTVLDINDDGTTIFTDQNTRPALQTYETQKVWTTVNEVVLRKGSVITLDIDQVCEETPCRDMTVEFRLREV